MNKAMRAILEYLKSRDGEAWLDDAVFGCVDEVDMMELCGTFGCTPEIFWRAIDRALEGAGS